MPHPRRRRRRPGQSRRPPREDDQQRRPSADLLFLEGLRPIPLSRASQTSTTASIAAMAALSANDRVATAGWMTRDRLRNATGGAAACPAGREDAADGGPTSPAGRAGVMGSDPRVTSRGVDGGGPAVSPESPPEAADEG